MKKGFIHLKFLFQSNHLFVFLNMFTLHDPIVFLGTIPEVRKEMGRQLARESHVDADIVMAIPDSGNSAALGYAEESGLPYEIGMTRNHYVGRTFIQPTKKFGI